MAAIGQIRKNYGLLVAIIGIALAAFILGDLFKSTPRQAINIGVVDGEEISYKDFSLQVEKSVEAEKTNTQKLQLTSSEVFRIKQTVWNRMVKDIIMQKELDELGLTVTSEELFDLVQGENPHRYILQYFKDPNTGQYNSDMVNQYLQSLDQMPRENQLQWIDFEKAIKEDQLNTKFNNLVSKAYYLPKAFGRMEDQRKYSEVEVQLVAQLYSSISDDEVEVTDADYENYYNDNMEDFKQDETRDIDYVVFDVKASNEDRVQQKNRFDEYYDEFRELSVEESAIFANSVSDKKYEDKWYKKGELPLQIEASMFADEIGTTVFPYMSNNAYHTAKLISRENRPDSLKASHILIAYAGAARAAETVTRMKPQAQALADSLLEVLKKSPKNIEKLALEFSDDGGVVENKGHYDWFADGQMVPEFFNAAMDNEINDVVVAESVFGFHVMRIDGKKDFSEKVKVALIERAIEPSNETYQQAYVKANEFASRCKTENFDDVAEDMGLSKRSMTDLGAMQENVPGQKEGRQIVMWAFGTDREVGDLELFDMGGSYLVSTLTTIQDEGYSSLENVKTSIASAVKNLKKADLIIENINSSSNKESLTKLAAELNTAIDTVVVTFETSSLPGFGPEPDVIGEAMSLDVNDFAGPVKGKKAVFVLKAVESRPSPEKSDYVVIDNQLANRFKSNVNFRLYRAIQDETDIEDNRHLFY